MVRPIVGEGVLLTCGPRVRSALVRVLEADDVVNVDEVTSFASVEAYGGIEFVAAIVEFFAVIALAEG